MFTRSAGPGAVSCEDGTPGANSRASASPPTRSAPRARPRLHRVAAGLAVAALLASAVGVLAAVPAGSHLVAVGPTSGDTGFPVWYKDSAGTRLELCLDSETSATPFCGFVPGNIPNPDAALTVPDNFPEEAFWMLGGANLTTGGGGKAVLTVALEAAFGGGRVAANDQITFGRIRIAAGGLLQGATYKVTHPYGVDTYTNVDAGARGLIHTEDVGIGAPGDFTGALNSRVGPFLTWSDFPNSPGLPNLPNGTDAFIGDPGIDHQIKGSPYGTNVFRMEGPAGSFTGSANLCANPLLGDDPVATTDCVETPLFSLLGKVATNAGVTATRATYTRSDVAGGTVDLYASSEADQSIQLAHNPSFATTALRGDGHGRYFAHLGFEGDAPATAIVRNIGDNPVAAATIPIVDRVTITRADYDSDAHTLTIEAGSSDTYANPTLTANGYGALVDGALVVNDVTIAPDEVAVTSANGGSHTSYVTVAGSTFAPVPVVAGITVPDGDVVAPIPPDTTLAFNVLQGQLIRLDGTSSTGDIDADLWTQTSGPVVTLAGADTPTASFTAPSEVATLTFQLTVSRTVPAATDTKDVTVNVVAAQPPVANAGPDQLAVVPGATVTLDASASTNSSTFNWLQTAGPAVVLNATNPRKPTFVVPVTTATLTFQLSTSGPGGGPSTDTVNVTPVQDQLTGTATYTRSKGEWRIDGTATIHGAPSGPGNSVTVTLNTTIGGVTTSLVLAPAAAVDTTGAWTLRFTTTDAAKRPVTVGATYTVTYTSSRGGLLPGRPITIK